MTEQDQISTLRREIAHLRYMLAIVFIVAMAALVSAYG